MVQVEQNNHMPMLVFEDSVIREELKARQVWEPEQVSIFDAFVTPDSVVVDAGAHVGLHALQLARLAKHVHAFEPMPETFGVLAQNARLNGFDSKMTLYSVGLSDRAHEAKYAFSWNGERGASGLAGGDLGDLAGHSCPRDVVVSCVTLDSLRLPQVDFMKVDVEGYETRVIAGALDTIRRCRPVIMLECWMDHDGHTSLRHTRRLHQKLLREDYTVHQVLDKPDYVFLPQAPPRTKSPEK